MDFLEFFFLSSWECIGDRLVEMVVNFFENDGVLGDLNKTDIVLIPKVDRSEWVSQFRPISLCNFAYKVISKVII